MARIFLFCFMLILSKGLLANSNDSGNSDSANVEGSCLSSEVDLSDENSLKEVLSCYQQEINALKDNQNLPLPAPGNLKEKSGVSVKFTGCKPSKNNKKTICHFNVFSPERVTIQIPNVKHSHNAYILDAKDISISSDCLALNEMDRCLGNGVEKKEIELVENRPISVKYLHKGVNKNLKAFYTNIFFNDEWNSYYFLVNNN